ncbi:MAG: aminodeoxychorismate lyase [Gammaproteobacteria bacterium]
MNVTLNGQGLVEGVSPYDRGLHYGDGLFETIVCVNGRARFLSLHLERLSLGCERLRIALGDVEPLRQEIEAAAAGGDVLIKVIVTRGDAIARGYGWSGSEVATRLMFRYPLPPENVAAGREGVRAAVAKLRYGENPQLAGLKHLNRLEQVLARSEVPVEDAAELLVFSSSGNLVSGTMSNVFLVRQGRVMTPELDRCGVAGIMRRVILREAAAEGVSVEERALTEADLAGADELFVCNARIGLWPVSTLDGREIGIGPVTRRVQTRLATLLGSAPDA